MGKVYIVEPSAFVRQYLETVIKSNGHQVYTASQGKEALLRFQSLFPDTVIIDVDLPDLDAVQVIQEMKKIEPQTKVVMTASSIDKS